MPIIDGLNWADEDDAQQAAVYAMSKDIKKYLEEQNKIAELSESDITKLITSTLAYYRIPYSPKINFKPKVVGRATGSLLNFQFPSWSRSNNIVIHELAHAVAQYLVKAKSYAPHGKEFVNILFNLLSKYFDIDRKILMEFARKHNVLVSNQKMTESFKDFV